MSASSSPSKPLSPHTPHTPAIPSRLSENSIIDYHGHRQAARRPIPTRRIVGTEGEAAEDAPVSQEGTTAIDIPLSPRLLHTGSSNRRASSVAQQHRASEEDDPDLVQRSISLGADDREAPTLSTLLSLQRASRTNPTGSPDLQPAAEIEVSGPSSLVAVGDQRNSPPGLISNAPYRLRYPTRSRPTPPQSSRGSFSAARYPGGSSMRTTGEEAADDEPLVFAMSELERDSRRSLEEARGGGSTGSGSSERGGFESRGISRRGW
jgi:autophagy-related protein 13